MKLTALLQSMLDWMARRDNPHQVTAAQADAYSKDQIDAKVSPLIKTGVLPVSYIGDYVNGTDFTPVWGGPPSILTIPEVPVMMRGTPAIMPETQIGPADYNASPYLYLILDAGEIKYDLQATVQAETLSRMFLMDLSKLVNMTPVLRLDTFRVSADQIGSAIPVSTGDPASAGTMNWS